LLTVLRYVERNALRAGLVQRAEDWRWGSLHRWAHRRLKANEDGEPRLADWPIDRPRYWRRLVNTPLSAAELEAVRRSVHCGRPLGSERWVATTAARRGLRSTLSPRGRPRREPNHD
jgi:putative transposase